MTCKSAAAARAAADLRQHLRLDDAAERLLERAFVEVEVAVWDEALALAARRTYDGQDPARAGYEMFRRTMLADLRRAKRWSEGA